MAIEKKRKKTSREAVLSLIGLGLILGVVAVLYSPVLEIQGGLVGNEAPDFSFQLQDGSPGDLVNYRGKAVLLNFWAYWCEPCREELPSLQQLENQLGDKAAILLVHIGDQRDEALKLVHLPAKLIFDSAASIASTYGVNGLPHTFLIDRTGQIRAEFRGPRNWTSSSIKEKILEALN